MTSAEKKQFDKFKETAKQLETDDSEVRFDRALKRVAKAPAPKRTDAKP